VSTADGKTGGAKPDESETPHYHGHRDRLRQRFLNGGADGLHDYEIVELLLFNVIPRRDVKPDAKRLIDRFGGLGGLLSAEPEELRAAGVKSDAAVALFKIVQTSALRLSQARIADVPLLSSWDALMDHCQATMAHARKEEFRILFLDKKNRLIADEVQQRGTIDHAPVYPREVMKRALELGATAMILLHNHPSGDPTPSRADIEMTKLLIQAASPLNIVIHDHVVIGKGQHASFRALGLL
jgi:DNA repair protein RadC